MGDRYKIDPLSVLDNDLLNFTILVACAQASDRMDMKRQESMQAQSMRLK